MLDVLVIGAGPCGAAAATVLARDGLRVLVIDQATFPRFHIGESLIPGVIPLLEEVGAANAVAEAGFVKKYAAEFTTGDRGFYQRYVFADSLTPEASYAYEVERDAFDAILVDNAREHGAEVRFGLRAMDIEQLETGVEVRLKDDSGEVSSERCKYLIDASGQRSLLAARLHLRQMDPALKNLAVFSHFSGVERSSGDAEGDITIVLTDEGWWWVIPLRNDRTSVGFVAPKLALEGAKPDAEFLQARLMREEYLRDRFMAAKRIAPVRTASNYSYASSKFSGARWLLAGDAAAFVDPVFSTGVFLGLSSGVRAARAVQRAIEVPASRSELFANYESWLQGFLDTYARFVRGFYEPEFVDLFMHPTRRRTQGEFADRRPWYDHRREEIPGDGRPLLRRERKATDDRR
jgi:flavin-dependent dehydrogenase